MLSALIALVVVGVVGMVVLRPLAVDEVPPFRVKRPEAMAAALKPLNWIVLPLAVTSTACVATSSDPVRQRQPSATVRPVGEALVIEGRRIEGGAPRRFTTTIDLNTGFSRTNEQMGSGEAVSGYDGVAWRWANGIIYLVDVPAQVADSRARAFVARQGWRRRNEVRGARVIARTAGAGHSIRYRPPGGSDVEIIYDDASGLAKQVVIDTEYGPVTTTYDDWRSVGSLRYPFRQVTTGRTGLTSAVEVERMRLIPRAAADAFARPAAQPRGRLVDGRAARVTFTPTGARQTHIRVPARISGRDATLIFDTGGYNSLTFEAAKRLGLTLSGGVGVVGAGSSSSESAYATIDRISLGSAELRDQTVEVGPSPFPPGTIDGSAGYEFLYEFRTTIDYAARTLTFTSFDQPMAGEGVTLPFYSDDNLIYVEGRIGNVRGLFRLDTGAGNTITLSPNFARRHGLRTDDSARVTGSGYGGEVVTRQGTLPSFSLAGLTFTKLPVQISQATAGGFAMRSIAGNLGAGVLQCFRMTFDYRARTVLFEPQPSNPNCGQGASRVAGGTP